MVLCEGIGACVKAVEYTKFGSPDVLRVVDVPEPTAQPGEVKVRVHAASVNAIDVICRSGQLKGRMISGITKPRFSILGFDFAGEVVSLGDGVSDVSVGDRVVGISRSGGANAEYLCTVPTALVTIPDHIQYVDAAAFAGAGSGAFLFLDSIGGLEPDRRVMVVGAAGGLGSYAVQLAHHYGAEVVGVCGSEGVDLVRSLGADKVIDYTSDDPTSAHEDYDVVFDAVAAGSFGQYRQALKPGGTYSTTVATPAILLNMALNRFRSSGRRAHFMMAGTVPHDDLQPIVALASEGSLKSIVDLELPLDHVAEAHRHYELGHTKGKIVLTHT